MRKRERTSKRYQNMYLEVPHVGISIQGFQAFKPNITMLSSSRPSMWKAKMSHPNNCT